VPEQKQQGKRGDPKPLLLLFFWLFVFIC